ncbi:polysaccharide deacetylase [Niallia circulans]|uniref:polysaccharide deacetylase family protein n=1 Tax=Shouchella clausii TaxID=79880 RepID=UPI000B974CAD|nr:polysaccharide deacetylase family protein [Shouchella clausii]SPT80747.1 polysaccharide deacetylase [Niallia circulans]AST96817.1 polysaccharide deacetylase [Shouchella clausii]MCR1287241.1 polysaccharide deacetylase [Shouchella clausii]MEB5471613.1 polysaccharide deacetylase [Shouchella clausii]PAF12925.1 polysaccharide deacetylase [Shouchella clausii]
MKKKVLFLTVGLVLVISVIGVVKASITEETKLPIKLEYEKLQTKISKYAESKEDYNQEKNEKVVYLTFDDGPNSATTEILDILDQFNAKATFFMLEPEMRKSPEIVKRIIRDGHSAGLHGVTHDKDQFYQSEQAALQEMVKTQETLHDISGVKSDLIRTPYGSIPYLTDSFREVFDQHGFKLWDWNVDSEDWNLSTEASLDSVISQIEKIENNGQSPIIVLHDKTETAKQLPNLLTYLLEKGYKPEKIDNDVEPYSFNCNDRCYSLTP